MKIKSSRQATMLIKLTKERVNSRVTIAVKKNYWKYMMQLNILKKCIVQNKKNGDWMLGSSLFLWIIPAEELFGISLGFKNRASHC